MTTLLSIYLVSVLLAIGNTILACVIQGKDNIPINPFTLQDAIALIFVILLPVANLILVWLAGKYLWRRSGKIVLFK